MNIKYKKLVYVRLIECLTRNGYDITEYVFDRPPIKNISPERCIEIIKKIELEQLDEEDKAQWIEDNIDILNPNK